MTDSDTREAISGGVILVIGVIAAVVVIVVLAIATQGFGFFLDTQNARHQGQINNIQAHNIQSGYAAQSGLLSDFNQSYSEIIGLGGGGQAVIDQRLAIANKACADASQITISMGPTDRAWVRANCTGPTVKADSSLRKGA